MKFRNGGKKRNKKQGLRYWIVAASAAGLIIAFSKGESRALTLALTEKGFNKQTIARSYDDDRNETQTRRFNIAAGTLEEVITAFEKATGWRVIIPNAELRTIASPGVSGVFSDEEALRRILKETNITYNFTDLKTVTLKIKDVNATVEVVDRETAVASTKYTEPLRNLPQTVTVINKETIEQQGATTLRDVLRNVTGLTVTAGEGGNPAGDNLTLRGFSARNDIFVDGVRDLSPQSRDPFYLEQVEVVKGPASTFTGRGSTGGTVNLVTKTPNLKPIYNFDLGLGSDKTKRVTGDVNFPLARLGLGDETAFRLNFMAHDADVAGRDEVENKRWGIAPSLGFAVGAKSFFTLSYLRVDQNNVSDYGIPWVPATNNVLAAYRDKPAPVPRSTFYGYRDRDREKLESNLGTLAFSHVFNDLMTLRNQLRYGFSTRDSIATPPRFTTSNNSTAINREMRSWLTEDEVWNNQTDFTARVKAFGIEHSIVSGVEFARENNIRRFRTATNALTTLFNPNTNDIYTGLTTTDSRFGDVTADSQGIYIFDTAKINSKFELTGGLRFDRFRAEGLAGNSGAALALVDRVDQKLNFRIGAVYKPVQTGSFYASYGTSFNPSLEGLSYNNASNVALDPEKTHTLEAGTKWDLLQNRILLTGAIFRVNKSNARTQGLLPGEQQVLEGKQRVDGIELGLTGYIRRNWNVFAGYTLLDARTVDSRNLSEIGRKLVNTPRNSFNLWTTYEFPFRLSLGGGARFVDRRFANTTNTRFVDSYWLIDATASYQITKNIDVRLNAYNLTNKYYFDRLSGGHIVPGAGRSVLVTTGFRF